MAENYEEYELTTQSIKDKENNEIDRNGCPEKFLRNNEVESLNTDFGRDIEIFGQVKELRQWDDDDSSVSSFPREPPSERFCNPEAPSQLDEELLNADTIGNTVYSKHWLFETLMKLIQVVESNQESSNNATEGIDIDDSLQTELCKLWDMTMTSDVVKYLLEYSSVQLLTGVIEKSNAPRATEICVGILGNMACEPEARTAISRYQPLRELVLCLLEATDVPTLVETTRLLYTCINNDALSVANSSDDDCTALWSSAILERKQAITQLYFIMKSSTNADLLRNTVLLMDKLMDLNDDLCQQLASGELVEAALEALSQLKLMLDFVLKCVIKMFSSDAHFDDHAVFLHVFQLTSTCEQGVLALVGRAEEVLSFVLRCLQEVCSDDVIVVEGKQMAITSALSVLSVIYSSWKNRLQLIVQDYQLIRCMLKILSSLPSTPYYEDTANLSEKIVAINSDLPGRKRTTSIGCNAIIELKNSSDSCVNERHLTNHDNVENVPPAAGVHFEGDGQTEKNVLVFEKTTEGLKAKSVPSGHEVAADLNAITCEKNLAVVDENETKTNENDKKLGQLLFDAIKDIANEVARSMGELTIEGTVPKTLQYLETSCETNRIVILVRLLNEIDEENGDNKCVTTLRSVVEDCSLTRVARIIHAISSTISSSSSARTNDHQLAKVTETIGN